MVCAILGVWATVLERMQCNRWLIYHFLISSLSGMLQDGSIHNGCDGR
jgi:hypothetical protein